jgi:hypothetical protein
MTRLEAMQRVVDHMTEAELATLRAENARLREAAERAAEWHEAAGKALSKGPWTGDAGWRWDQHTEQGTALTAALTAAGYVILPAEMTSEQAARSLDGHALPDRVRDVNPEMFATLVRLRRATWRQMVAVMQEPPADG